MHEIIRNHILHLLQKDGTPRKLIHLEQELGIRGELREAFREAMDSLCAEGTIIVGPGNLVLLPSLSGEITGIFRANARGYGFITPEQSTADGDLFIPAGQSLAVVPDLGDAIPKVEDAPWPGFPPDMMSVGIVVATQANGTILFHEKMFESRLFFVDKLIGMGARIVLCDPHRCIVQGISRLQAEPQGISSPDIRAGMALLLAALCAQGTSVIRNIGQIDRGYECVEEKLQALGARIERVTE